jgi:hypothetical protein
VTAAASSAPTDAERQDAEVALGEVTRILQGRLRLTTRWSGRVRLVSLEVPFYGRMLPNGDVELRIDRWRDVDLRWRTLIHEALHGLSPGFSTFTYQHAPGWEEGVVEQLTRLLLAPVVETLSLAVDAETVASVEREHFLNPYVQALEQVRARLGMMEEEFYSRLLAEPLNSRVRLIAEWGRSQLAGGEFRRFLVVLAQTDRTLKEPLYEPR